MIYNNITELIGNTPLLKIDQSVHKLNDFEIYAKLEYYNPFGSLKDRVALNILEPELLETKKLNKIILESSSGNTAKALAILAKINNLEFKTITNRIKVQEIRMMLQFLGAQIDELPGLSSCPDPNNPNDPITIANNLSIAEPTKWTYTDQYFNENNWKAHQKTGEEIINDLGTVDYFFGVLGTCGSTFGAASYMQQMNIPVKTIGVISEAASWIPGGRNINELWETGFFDKKFYTDIVSGSIEKAIEGMQIINQKCGILAGPTSGLNYACMIDYLQKIDNSQTFKEKQKVVFIACDRAEPYMNYVKKYCPDIFEKSTQSRLTVNNITPDQIAISKTIEPDQLLIKINSQNPPIIIDIRGNFAYSIGHIPSSINILDELFGQMIHQGSVLPKNKEIVVVCAVGLISKKYVAFLEKQGYQAYSLAGGFGEWKENNNKVEITNQIKT